MGQFTRAFFLLFFLMRGFGSFAQFISDRYASITPSVKKLKDFQKVTLLANSSKTVSFSINQGQLKFCNSNGKWIIEPGDMDVMIGKLTSSFYLKN